MNKSSFLGGLCGPPFLFEEAVSFPTLLRQDDVIAG